MPVHSPVKVAVKKPVLLAGHSRYGKLAILQPLASQDKLRSIQSFALALVAVEHPLHVICALVRPTKPSVLDLAFCNMDMT